MQFIVLAIKTCSKQRTGGTDEFRATFNNNKIHTKKLFEKQES